MTLGVFFKNNFFGLARLILPLLIAVNILYTVIIHYAHDIEHIGYIARIPELLMFPVIQCALIFYISSTIAGEPLKKKYYYRLALTFFVPLMMLYIITTIAIITGLILLILPGIIVLVRSSFAEFYCTLYKKSPVNALQLSWVATKDYQWTLLAGLIIMWLATTIPFSIIKIFFFRMDLWNPVSVFLYQVVESFFAILLTIFTFRIFTLLPSNTEIEKVE